MAAEYKKQIGARLAEVFGSETQEVTARKLHTVQGNVSKWVRGSQIPTTDTLIEIGKAYKVSVDWILGFSDQKEVDGVALDKLTYEQIVRIIDLLIANQNIEIPNLTNVDNGRPLPEDFDEEELFKPRIDSDYIKVNDRVLSYLLRRRYKINETGTDMLDLWKENGLTNFRALRLLSYEAKMQEAIEAHNDLATFKDAEWVALAQELHDLNDEELDEHIKTTKEREDK